MSINVRVYSQNGYAAVISSNTDVVAKLKSSGASIALARRGVSSPGSSASSSARRSPSSKPPGLHEDPILIRAANARNQPQHEIAGR